MLQHHWQRHAQCVHIEQLLDLTQELSTFLIDAA